MVHFNRNIHPSSLPQEIKTRKFFRRCPIIKPLLETLFMFRKNATAKFRQEEKCITRNFKGII